MQENVFGYYVVTKETPGRMHAIYQLVWDGGLLKATEFGFPKRKTIQGYENQNIV